MRYLLLFIFIIISSITNAQGNLSHSLLVELEKGIGAKNVLNDLNRYKDIKGRVKVQHICSEPSNIWKFNFDDRNEDMDNILYYLHSLDKVEKIQYNHLVKFRNTPDDPMYTKQWSLNNTGQEGGKSDADIDADLAWDLTTGGVTKNGDSIVICIIDNGIDSDHEDLKENLWINYGEIPDNGIDDDNNGYIDDYFGWNTFLNNDDIEGKSHGTSVAGIVGAKGNNSKGVTGINWDVKMMIILNGPEEADVLEAYSYVFTMRKLYNESGGTKGAFIVATNSSFGVNYGKAADFPIWCSMYDKLGSVGVINIGATSNNNVDVDEMGDIPSTCPSDYLISVTNVDHENIKVNGSGYGKENVDLGSYGIGSFSTGLNNGYKTFGGTSAATPHVTGVTGLIYSYGDQLSEISKDYPSQAALMVRQALLNGVKKNESLKNITKTEGVLNAFNSLGNIKLYDETCSPPTKIFFDSVGVDLVSIKWNDYNSVKKYNMKYRTVDGNWAIKEDVSSPFTLNDLSSCTEYYFRFQTECDNEKSDFGFVFKVKTDGCCDIPVIVESKIENDSLYIEWEKVLASEEYEINFKYWTFDDWETKNTTSNFVNLGYDFDCGEYIVQIKSKCEFQNSEYSNFVNFGDECISCSEIDYCSHRIDNVAEWIDSFSIGNFGFYSGKDINGIGEYNKSKSIKLITNNEYDISAKIGYKESSYDDFLYLWIDLNSDGNFDENELLLNVKTDEKDYFFDKITIPLDANIGETRLRILLSAYEKSSACSLNDSDYGEYEDYCITIDSVQNCHFTTSNIDTINVSENTVDLKWNNVNDFPQFYLQYYEIENEVDSKRGIYTVDSLYTILNLKECTNYELLFATYCTSSERQFVDTIQFKTECGNATHEESLKGFKIYPNPTSGEISIMNLGQNGQANIEIFDLVGKKVYSEYYNSFSSSKIMMDDKLHSGLFFIKINGNNKQYIYKLIKQ